MPSPLDTLLNLLNLEPLEVNIYRGVNRDLGTGRVYGGQVFAQALVAAKRTVDDDTREAHSAHGYFILPGDLKAPIVYFVDRLRDGRSFTTRRVTAISTGRRSSTSRRRSTCARRGRRTSRRCPMRRIRTRSRPSST